MSHPQDTVERSCTRISSRARAQHRKAASSIETKTIPFSFTTSNNFLTLFDKTKSASCLSGNSLSSWARLRARESFESPTSARPEHGFWEQEVGQSCGLPPNVLQPSALPTSTETSERARAVGRTLEACRENVAQCGYVSKTHEAQRFPTKRSGNHESLNLKPTTTV